jgi:hypothetical protein
MVAFCILGVIAAAASLTGCSQPAPLANPAPAGASPSQSYLRYPPLSTTDVESNSACQLARNSAVPAAKRSSAAGECDALFRHGTVTKSAPPPSHTRRPLPPATQSEAPDCVSGQLSARFFGGGFGTGNDFAEIRMWNPGLQPCRVHGPVTFAGYYADGSVDRNATVNRRMTATPRTLPGKMPAPREGQDPSGYLVADLMGPERDDPAQPNALCRPQDEGTPAGLELSVGSLTFRVSNKDPDSPQNISIFGCHGQVLLVGVWGPSS